MRRYILFPVAIILFTVIVGCSALTGPSTPPSPIIITATPTATSATEEVATPTLEEGTSVIPATTPAPDTGATQPPVVVGNPTAAAPQTPIIISTPEVGVPGPAPDGQCAYKATFLGDMTIPDNSVIPGGSTFVKTWRVRNDGTCSWGSDGFAAHNVIQTGGNLSGPSSAVELPAQVVNRGDVIDISVSLTAPTNPGTYRSEWKFHVDNGPAFGVGPGGQSPLYAQIVVPSAPVPQPTQQGTCTYVATFVADVTIPDNTTVLPGTSFTKTWRVRNDGTCSWGTAGFALHTIVAAGDTLSPVNSVELPAAQVDQGQTVDISVPMTAPTTPGTYRSEWRLKVDNYGLIGVGPGGASPLYAQIVVPSGSTTTQRIVFQPGATQAVVSDSLAAGQSKVYYVNAQAGQTMLLTLTSPVTGNPVFDVVGSGEYNPQVMYQVQGNGYWRGLLPVSGDYIIRVRSTGAATSFSLNVVIPQRISFAPGSVSGTVQGMTSNRQTVTFLLKANAQQQATFTLSASAANAAGLTIYGVADGQPLAQGVTTWSGPLPATEDYVIEVVPTTDASFSFSLTAVVQ